MWTTGKRIKILVGHYGSGKTEIALNMAMSIARAALPVALVDLDIVNPFFRSAERGEWLNDHGIRLIAPEFALTAVDIPSLPADILSVFERDDLYAVFDVGGDDAGAVALGRYKNYFERCGYELIYVVNRFRPRSERVEDILDMMQRVAYRARLEPTGLINNANLGGETSAAELMAGQELLLKVSKASNLPILATTGTHEVLSTLQKMDVPTFEIERLMKPEWIEV